MKIKFHTKPLPEWLLNHGVVIGAEGDDDSGSASGDSGTGEGGDDPDAGAGDDEDASGSDSDVVHDDADDPKVKGLKSALSEERKSNKANARRLRQLEKELRAAKTAQEERELAEKTEAEQAKIKAEKAEQKAQKLAEGLRKREIKAAIERAARDAKFIDPDDAIQGVDWSKIEVIQDDEDPSDIEVDVKSVVAQVKGLAARKKHLIKTGTDDGDATGSTFAGGGRKKGDTDEDHYKSMYPALR